MVEKPDHSIVIDLNHFKLHICIRPDTEFTLLFNSPSRRFYLSVIALVVHQMKERGEIVSIRLNDHHQVLALLNESIGEAAGSSKKEQLFSRIYRKWKDALPDLENRPLFKVIGRKTKYNEATSVPYDFSESVKDGWANLFDYKGSHDQVRLRFSIDRLGLGLDDVAIVFGDSVAVEKTDAWEDFIASLQTDTQTDQALKQSEGEEISADRLKPHIISAEQRAKKRLFPLIAAVCLVTLACVGGWVYWSTNTIQPHKSPPIDDTINTVLPEKPSIAVLPFENMTGDAKQNYFCDGMTEQIITGLSQGSFVDVTSRTSSFSFRGKSMTSPQIAEELKVRYLLEGSVQRDGNLVRITAQLVDGGTGNHVWAEHYDYQYEDLFSLQDKITMEVMTALNVNASGFIGDASFNNLRPKTLEAYEYYLNARYIHLRRKTEEIHKAREAIEKAIELDPTFAPAYNIAGLIYLDEVTRGKTKDPDEVFERAEQCVQKIEELDPDYHPYLLQSHIYRLKKDFDNAVKYGELAVKQTPNNPYYYFFLGLAQLNSQRFKEQKQTIETGLKLIPFRPVNFLWVLGLAHVGLEEYDEAIPILTEVVERAPKSFFAYLSYRGLVISHELSGNHEKAVWAAENIMRIKPDFSLERDRNSSFLSDGEFKDRVYDAFQRAGLK